MKKYLCLEIREGLRDDIKLLAGYANLHARKHLPQNGEEFSAFHSAIGSIYGHLDMIDAAKAGKPAFVRADPVLRDLVRRLRNKRDDYDYRCHGHTANAFDEGYLKGLTDAIVMLQRALGDDTRESA